MPKIDELFAFVSERSRDDEGLAAFRDARDGIWMPMVAADVDRANSMREIAQDIANKTGRSIRLVRFHEREELEVIEPVLKT